MAVISAISPYVRRDRAWHDIAKTAGLAAPRPPLAIYNRLVLCLSGNLAVFRCQCSSDWSIHHPSQDRVRLRRARCRLRLFT
jgi:hypothetical protein